jgi:VanZ family protein
MGLTGTVLCMVLIGFGAMITPGVGVGGSLLALFPQPVTEFAHVPAYGLLTWLLTISLEGRGWPKRMALCVGIVISLVFGVGMEFLQGFVPGRFVEIGDVVFNVMGIGLAALLMEMTPERAYALAAKFLR